MGGSSSEAAWGCPALPAPVQPVTKAPGGSQWGVSYVQHPVLELLALQETTREALGVDGGPSRRHPPGQGNAYPGTGSEPESGLCPRPESAPPSDHVQAPHLTQCPVGRGQEAEASCNPPATSLTHTGQKNQTQTHTRTPGRGQTAAQPQNRAQAGWAPTLTISSDGAAPTTAPRSRGASHSEAASRQGALFL